MQTIINELFFYCKTDGVPLAEVWSRHGQVRGVESWVDGVVQLTSAVVPTQSQVAAGGMVDTPLPGLPAMLRGAGAEGFLHLLIPVGAVTVAVVSARCSELQPVQGLLQSTLTPIALCTWRRGCPCEGRAGLDLGHRLLPGWWHGRLERQSNNKVLATMKFGLKKKHHYLTHQSWSVHFRKNPTFRSTEAQSHFLPCSSQGWDHFLWEEKGTQTNDSQYTTLTHKVRCSRDG